MRSVGRPPGSWLIRPARLGDMASAYLNRKHRS
jgi:hypothetical protein